MDKEYIDLLNEDDQKFLKELDELIEGKFPCRDFKCIIKLLKFISCLLAKKVKLEEGAFPSINSKLDTIIEKLNTKITLENTIIDRLNTKITQQDTIIGLLAQKVALETPPPPGVECECRVVGTAQGQIGANPALRAVLNANVCDDCTTVQGSTLVYNVFNPQNFSIREVVALTFQEINCNLNPSGDGTLTISGTALVRTGVGSQPQQGVFTLTGTVDNNELVSYTISADSINDSVTITSGTIVVEECPD